MEYIFSIHSPERIFGGAPPTKPDEYLKRFLLTMTACPTGHCARQRPYLLERWWAFFQRYFITGGPVSSEKVNEAGRKDSTQKESREGESQAEKSKQRMIRKTKPKKRPHGLKTSTPVKNIFYKRYVEHGTLNLSTANIAKLLSRTTKTGFPPQIVQSNDAEKTTSFLNLLDIVREGVAAEESHLKFDYFGFHERS